MQHSKFDQVNTTGRMNAKYSIIFNIVDHSDKRKQVQILRVTVDGNKRCRPCLQSKAMSTQIVDESSSLHSPASSENQLFDDPDADIILRSCDHREFRVLKFYIIKVSPVLRDLIESALSSHAANPTASLPSVQLSDSGTTLSSLLTFILPMLPAPPSAIEQTVLLLSAAQKYEMYSILSRIRTFLSSQDPPFIRPETAFKVYTLAQTYELRQEALQAARSTLTFSFTLEDLEGELCDTPGVHIRELWKYHQGVQARLAQDLTAFKTASMPLEEIGQPCNNSTPIWLGEYIDSIAETPSLFNINEFHMFLSRHVNDKHHQCMCAGIPTKAIHVFWMALANVVHGCMTNVSVQVIQNICHW
jgi:BTB/POZ domain